MKFENDVANEKSGTWKLLSSFFPFFLEEDYLAKVHVRNIYTRRDILLNERKKEKKKNIFFNKNDSTTITQIHHLLHPR